MSKIKVYNPKSVCYHHQKELHLPEPNNSTAQTP